MVAGGKRGVHPRTSAELNSAVLDGCPFVAQRGDVLYFASGREGGAGGLDIWYSLRGTDGGWGDPVNFAAVNSAVDDFCPMAHRNGRTFLFVNAAPRRLWGCRHLCKPPARDQGLVGPMNLGCGINSVAGEASPSLTDTELYFSSTRAEGPGGSDIYVSALDGTSLGAPIWPMG